MLDKRLRDKFPNLAHILIGYLDQDFDIYGPTLDDAIRAFVNESSGEEILEARREIVDFLQIKANDLEAELERLAGLYSRFPGMSAHDYLLWIDGQLAEGLLSKS